MSNEIYLSVIIPAYNEEKRILTTLIDVDRYLSHQNYNYEIMVISDGSKDKTVEVVKSAQKKLSNIKIIDNKNNCGKGCVVKQGMLEAEGKYRLFMDADNSTTIDHLDKFWPFILNQEDSSSDNKNIYDVVIGSIEIEGAKVQEGAAWYRRLLGKLSKYLIRFLAGLWEIHDSQRGFKLFTDESAEKIFFKQRIMRWGFDIEILAIAKKMGFKIKEVPVDWNNPGESKVTLGSYIRTFQELLKIKYNLLTNKYKIK